ncbi:MAG TPA: transglycosylase domain-containing protein, partial [Thermoanaerobaculia bacterium]|nr:transglycosylase domain-containing protein [Thermoanaerobaculia bacterium]
MPLRKLLFIGVLLLAVIVIAVTGWYAWRVHSELGSRPWRHANQILTHDGEVLLEIHGDVWRPADAFRLEDLPEQIPLVFLAAEDIRFRRHFGVDPIGVGRAALTNVREGGVTQGGSTITQQLAKSKFFSQERTFRRKAMEALVAVLIELRLSKDDILEAYLNDVYLGHQDGRPVLGIDEAARLYFNRRPEKLSLAEAAMLAGMIRAPNRDTAEKRPEVAKRRRNAILQVMLDEKWITEEEFEEAS